MACVEVKEKKGQKIVLLPVGRGDAASASASAVANAVANPKRPTPTANHPHNSPPLTHPPQDLGYDGDCGYNTFLYPSEASARGVLQFLVRKLPVTAPGGFGLGLGPGVGSGGSAGSAGKRGGGVLSYPADRIAKYLYT